MTIIAQVETIPPDNPPDPITVSCPTTNGNEAVRVANYSPFAFVVNGAGDDPAAKVVLSPFTQNVFTYLNTRSIQLSFVAQAIGSDVSNFPVNMHLEIEFSNTAVMDFGSGSYPAPLPGISMTTIDQGQPVPGGPPAPAFVLAEGGDVDGSSALLVSNEPFSAGNYYGTIFPGSTTGEQLVLAADPNGYRLYNIFISDATPGGGTGTGIYSFQLTSGDGSVQTYGWFNLHPGESIAYNFQGEQIAPNVELDVLVGGDGDFSFNISGNFDFGTK